jgi:hypothetical protein
VPREDLDEAAELLRGLAARWPKSPLVVTSRPIGFRSPLFWGLVVAEGLMLAAALGAVALFGPRLVIGLPGPLFLGAVLLLIARRFAIPHGPAGASRCRR